MQENAIKPGQNVIIIDDLIATGNHITIIYIKIMLTSHYRWISLCRCRIS
jgi:adenine/guanine phosphoribosyltransferase-like PRPP-binding protein